MQLNMLLYLAVILISGLVFGRLAKLIKLPNVTGYLVAGLLLGPYVLHIIPANVTQDLDIISDIALAFIAFSIGSEFKLSYFKRVGVTPVVIALFQSLSAVILVTAVLMLTGQEPAFSLVLGSIAASTAPAATIMVVRQYQAKGPVTETLMSVVAMDDAVGLIAFGFATAIARVLNNQAGQASLVISILKPFEEILLALGIGALFALIMKIPLIWFKKQSNRLIIATGFILLVSGIGEMLNISYLLACMALGGVFVNVSSESDSIMKITDFVTPPIFLMFFVVSGAELDITVIPMIGLVGIIYVLGRVSGKFVGAYLGGRVSGAPDTVRKYLGLTLVPQAGVAIGLTLLAEKVVPDYAPTIKAVILCSTLIYEMAGPVATKIALKKAGEIEAA